jgi:hypothetical protein
MQARVKFGNFAIWPVKFWKEGETECGNCAGENFHESAALARVKKRKTQADFGRRERRCARPREEKGSVRTEELEGREKQRC